MVVNAKERRRWEGIAQGVEKHPNRKYTDALEVAVPIDRTALEAGSQTGRPVEDEVINRFIQDKVGDAIKKLPPRQQFVVTRYYGVGTGSGDGDRETLSQLAKKLGISPERVKQERFAGESKIR